VKWFVAVAVWLLATAILAPVSFFATIILAGPHSSILPGFLQPVVALLAVAVLLVTPLWLARAAWRRIGRSAVVE
jgi:hypothetical protein